MPALASAACSSPRSREPSPEVSCAWNIFARLDISSSVGETRSSPPTELRPSSSTAAVSQSLAM